MSSEEAEYPAAFEGVLSSETELFTGPELPSGTELFTDPELSSGTELFTEPELSSGTEVLQSGGSRTLNKRVSNAIHKFLKDSAKGGAKSSAYKRSRKRMQQRRKRRSSKAKGLKDYPIVGPALNSLVSNVAKPLQMVDDLVVKPVQGHGRNAIKLVAGPLTKGIRSLSKKKSSKKSLKKSLKKPSKRSGKKGSKK